MYLLTHYYYYYYYYYENEYRTKVHKKIEKVKTHTMNELDLYELHHKINVFTVKTL